MKKVFIDSDIILDVLQEREPFYPFSAQLFSLLDIKEIKGFVSPLIFANLYYILRKKKGSAFAVRVLSQLKMLVKVLPMNDRTVEFALHSGFRDFEDALQYSSALESDVDVLITRNKKDYKKADIPVMTAEEFLKAFG
jgi:predicted nucleic acid-binding protein